MSTQYLEVWIIIVIAKNCHHLGPLKRHLAILGWFLVRSPPACSYSLSLYVASTKGVSLGRQVRDLAVFYKQEAVLAQVARKGSCLGLDINVRF